MPAFRHKLLTIALPVAAPLLVAAAPAQAYIGPGAGAGTIAVVLGVLASIVMAFFAIVWYPVKRLIKRSRKPAAEAETRASDTAEPAGSA